MKYLLDTCVISDFVRGEPGTLHRIKTTSPALLVISSITAMEIEYGLRLNPERGEKLAKPLGALLDRLTMAPFEREDALAAAGLRAALRRAGTPIGAYDVLLAGCAARLGFRYRQHGRVCAYSRAGVGKLAGIAGFSGKRES